MSVVILLERNPEGSSQGNAHADVMGILSVAGIPGTHKVKPMGLFYHDGFSEEMEDVHGWHVSGVIGAVCDSCRGAI